MSNLVKSITLRATVQTDATGLKDGLQQIKSLRRQIEGNPIKIGFKFDATGIRAEAVKAAGLFQKEVTQAMASVKAGGAGTTSKGGIFIPAGAMSEMKSFAATGKGAFREVRAENGKLIQSFEQVAAGIQRVTSVTKKGKNVKLLDTRPLDKFQEELAKIERKFAGQLGAAKGGKGDVAGILRAKQAEITAVLNDPKLTEAIRNTPTWNRADRSLDRLEERIQSTTGSQNARSDRQKRNARIEELKKNLLTIDQLTTGGIGTARATGKGLAQELADKRAMIQAQLAAFADIADSGAYRQAQKAMNTLAGGGVQARTSESIRDQKAAERERKNLEKAKRADFDRRRREFIDRTDDAVNRNLLKQSKAVESIAKRETNQFTREQAINQVMAERTAMLNKHITLYERLAGAAKNRGNLESASAYQNAARRLTGQRNQITLDQTRAETERINQMLNSQFKSSYNKLLSDYHYRMEELRVAENRAKQIKNRKQRSTAESSIIAERAALQQQTIAGLQGIHSQSILRGDHGMKDNAERSISGIQRQAIGNLKRLEDATLRSGHAFNFHSSSLLRNAATFTKWYIPAQLAMASFSAIGSGIRGAVEAQRTFKILNAVYRGSTEDAAKLAEETLSLAAANGRSADEAAQAAVAWARMGLTRQQILVAMETSLRAANVAEISAAEATAYLTANYKAFGQTIADIPATLDYINALSNKNAVAPKQIFDGLSRSAKVAKQAGITFQETAAIISTVSAEQQRPGAEAGNALKTVLSRLVRPKTLSDLKEQFKLDFSTPEGDVKRMTDVLSELAALYPKLNTVEQGRLKNLVAGTNQGNRFAIIMDSWTESLIAQAKAGLDSNSAMRENEQIISSVASKVDGLSASWTNLFHTLGEAGIFDFVSAGLQGAAEGLNSLKEGIRGIEETISMPKAFGRANRAQFQRLTSSGGLTPIMLYKTVRDAINGNLLGEDPDKKVDTKQNSTLVGMLASRAVQARNRVSALGSGEKAFRIMAKQFGTEGIPNSKILKQFDQAVEILSALPGGEANVARARLKIRPLIESGNITEGRKALERTSAYLYLGQQDELKGAESNRKSSIETTKGAISATTKEMERLNAELSKPTPGDEQDKLKLKLYETEKALKEQQDALATLQEQFNKDVPDPLENIRDSMNGYLSDLEAVSKAYGSLMTSFGSSGFANLDAKLKIGASRLQGTLLEQSLGELRKQNAIKDDNGIAPSEKAQRDALASTLEYRLGYIREATKEAERMLELERQTAALNTAYSDSRRSTASAFGSFEIGTSEGERLGNRGRGILRQLRQDVADPNLGAGDATRDARELGAITERMVQAKDNLFSLEDRLNRAVAERANLELQITEENRKQNEEASKRLATASREDQLRAAASQAFLRSRGKDGYSMAEFQFFSGDTRNAIANLTPRSVKGLDDSEKDQQRRREELDKEIQGIAVSLRGLRDAFNEVLPKAETKAGGIIDTEKPFGGAAPTADRITNLDTSSVRVNLNTGPINVQLDFSRHVGEMLRILQGKMDSQFGQFAREIRSQIGFNRDLDMSGVNGAF